MLNRYYGNNTKVQMTEEAKSETHSKPIEVKSINLYATWNFKGNDSTCYICKSFVTEPCAECIQNTKCSTDCIPSEGDCGHVFHYHCIENWRQQYQHCPIDRNPWGYKQRNLAVDKIKETKGRSVMRN